MKIKVNIFRSVMVCIALGIVAQFVSAFQYIARPDQRPVQLRTTQIGLERKIDNIQKDLNRIDEPRRQRLIRIEAKLDKILAEVQKNDSNLSQKK
jgi:hypothetical protein